MLKVGVFGVGHLGKIHLNNWKEIEGVELIGFFDPSQQISKEVSEKFQLPSFDNAEQLMDACDLVDIVAPTTEHFEISKAAITKGKHVFVEKPLANTMDEARELLKLAKEANIKFKVGMGGDANIIFNKIETYGLDIDVMIEAKQKELTVKNYKEKFVF
jgi:predicted dehydrogenase